MQPLVEIHRVGARDYSYRVSTPSGLVHEAETAFDSLANCLFHAGDSLHHYFTHVDVNFEGRQLGRCATEALCRLPQRVAERVESALRATAMELSFGRSTP